MQNWQEEKKKVWVDEEQDEERLQNERVAQLEGMLREMETKTKDRS